MTGQEPGAEPIKVLLVDPHEPSRTAIAANLDAQPDLRVAAALATAHEAIEHLALLAPHIAVIDARLPEYDGTQLWERINQLRPDTKCILHANTIDPETETTPSITAVVLKQLTGDHLVKTIRNILDS